MLHARRRPAFVAILTAAVVMLTACSSNGADAKQTADDAKHTYSTIAYEISGNWAFASYDDALSAGIIWPEDKTRVELTGEDLPVSYAFVTIRPAERQDTVTCKIFGDGDLLVEKSAKGDANFAECAVHW